MQQGNRIAAIDIGTNSVRLLVAEISDSQQLEPLYKHIITTRIGEGFAASGRLSDDAMDRTVDAIDQFKTKALQMGAQRVLCYATAAVREAENKDTFIRRTHKRTQLLVDVLPGEMEAQISFAGVPGTGIRCTLDIGGGSTEIALGVDNIPLTAISMRLGAVRATELYPLGDPVDLLTVTAMQQWASHVMKNDLQSIHDTIASLDQVNFYGVGGTCTTLAAMDQKLIEYDPEKVHGYVLTQKRVNEILAVLSSLTLKERKMLPGLEANRADIIIGGVVILSTFMKKLNVQGIKVSERDNLEGYIILRLKNEQKI